MNPRRLTLASLLISLVVILFAVFSLKALTTEDAARATQRYDTSGHADRESLAFTRWSRDDPPIIPAGCARCHSTLGFLDFLGQDGSHPGSVEQGAPVGGVIACAACHNPSAYSLTSVHFHSGVLAEPLREEARCMACHQARQSASSVDAALQGLPEDAVSADLNVISPHYHFAASVQLGTEVHSGYQYPGQRYVGRFAHAPGAETCTDCHNPHSLQVEPRSCAPCHVSVVDGEDLDAIRMQASDYDGDGDTAEGIRDEIVTLQALLYEAIQAYARAIAGTPIVYADRSPFFFVDADGDGVADQDEISASNRYSAWTPRLLRAAYNYLFAQQDAGGYVHNARYVIQLLVDSRADLGRSVPLPEIDLLRP